MVPWLLGGQAPRRLLYLMDSPEEAEVVLRVMTLLANVASTARIHSLSPTQDLPPEDKAPAPETMYKYLQNSSYIGRKYILTSRIK